MSRKSGIFADSEYKLPKGYTLGENSGYDKDLHRYLWKPEKGRFLYHPPDNKIYKYLEWNYKPVSKDAPPDEQTVGYAVSMDGYGHLKDLKTGEDFWVNNIECRRCIPIIKKRKVKKNGS